MEYIKKFNMDDRTKLASYYERLRGKIFVVPNGQKCTSCVKAKKECQVMFRQIGPKTSARAGSCEECRLKKNHRCKFNFLIYDDDDTLPEEMSGDDVDTKDYDDGENCGDFDDEETHNFDDDNNKSNIATETSFRNTSTVRHLEPKTGLYRGLSTSTPAAMATLKPAQNILDDNPFGNNSTELRKKATSVDRVDKSYDDDGLSIVNVVQKTAHRRKSSTNAMSADEEHPYDLRKSNSVYKELDVDLLTGSVVDFDNLKYPLPDALANYRPKRLSDAARSSQPTISAFFNDDQEIVGDWVLHNKIRSYVELFRAVALRQKSLDPYFRSFMRGIHPFIYKFVCKKKNVELFKVIRPERFVFRLLGQLWGMSQEAGAPRQLMSALRSFCEALEKGPRETDNLETLFF